MDSPSRERAHELIERLLDEANRSCKHTYELKLTDFPVWQDIRQADPTVQAAFYTEGWIRVCELALRLSDRGFGASRRHAVLKLALSTLARRNLPLQAIDFIQILDPVCAIAQSQHHYWVSMDAYALPIPGLMNQLDTYAAVNALPPPIAQQLRGLYPQPTEAMMLVSSIRFGERLDQLLGVAHAKPLLDPIDPWAEAAMQEISQIPGEAQSTWIALLKHGAKGSGSKPSAKWLNDAGKLLDALGRDTVTTTLERWLRRVNESRGEMHETNSSVLKGLLWMTPALQSDALPMAIGDATAGCFRKIPGVGAVSVKAGNAGLYALGEIGTPPAVAQLARLRMRVKYANAQTAIQKALDEAARKAGMSRADLEDISVPTYGLDATGLIEELISDYTARIRVENVRVLPTEWIAPGGKPLKTLPADVKKTHAEELKELKRRADDIAQMLTAQRLRIERQYLEEREWPFATWKERFIDHPLVSQVARRLIWQFESSTGVRTAIAFASGWIDAHGNIVRPADDDTVRLWHPIRSSADEVLAWRTFLEERQIKQPFKQAHREVYILTDAERRTNTYSNRFAAHILRQHIFAALCRERAWKYAVMGWWDNFNTPTLTLPEHDLSIEFQVDVAGNEGGTNDLGVATFVTTDQVRFVRGNPIPLDQVPPLLFSEAMRDVDLFVGVCSVGNDPQWTDGGANPFGRDYWHTYSFGDLNASAQTRKDVLSRLLPKLKIAPQCELQDKFLIVRGQIKTYKIHLGSGNILMSPNDQYLCIVRGGTSDADGIHLPFEGDTMMSIILSKAFMLAEDKKIKDQTILSQLK